jgi:hypothetical protein
MLILEAVTYASQRLLAGVPAATSWVWRRDTAAYLTLREWGRDDLAERLLDLTLGTEQEIQASVPWEAALQPAAPIERGPFPALPW